MLRVKPLLAFDCSMANLDFAARRVDVYIRDQCYPMEQTLRIQ